MNSRTPALLVVALIALAPAIGRAQTVTLTLTDDLQTARLNPSGIIQLSAPDCSAASPAKIGFTFTTATDTTTTTSTNTETLYMANTSSCSMTSTDQWRVLPGTSPSEPVGGTSGNAVTTVAGGTAGEEQYNTSGGLTAQDIFAFAEHPPINNTPSVPSGAKATASGLQVPDCTLTTLNQSVFICVAFGASTTTTAATIGYLQILAVTTPPPLPSSITVGALNNGLQVNWSMPSGTTFPLNFKIFATDMSGNIQKDQPFLTGLNTFDNTTTITGLTNLTPYNVFVQVLDNSGYQTNYTDANPATAPAVVGTPEPVVSFLQGYADDGGQGGGCATGGGSTIALVALGAFLLWKRRRAAAMSALLVCALGTTARADSAPTGITTAPAPFVGLRGGSPRHFTVQLNIGPMVSNMDSSAGLAGTKPFETYFGKRNPVLYRGEFDVDVFQKFGRLSLGIAAGYWGAVGKAQKLASQGGGAALDQETFNLFPVSAILLYRADFLWERWSIPLVPYGKIGFGLVPYTDLTDGSTTKVTLANGQTVSSQGLGYGPEYAVGVQLILDFLDQKAAAAFDQEVGINSTSLFAEFGQARWMGVGGGPQIGGTIISGGLLMAF